MGLNRREFLRLMTAAGAAGATSEWAYGQTLVEKNSILFQEDEREGLSIMQGLTDEKTTQFAIVAPKGFELVFRFSVLSGQGTPPVLNSHQIVAREYSDHVVHKLNVSGLKLDSVYELVVGSTQGIVDSREFRALDLSQRQVRLAMVSCALDHLSRDSMWTQVENQKPDMLFFLGDSVYTDRNVLWVKKMPDDKQIWHRYVSTRNRLSIYFHKKLLPIVGIWDDHDFGGNNMGAEFKHKDESLAVFEAFFAQEDRECTMRGPGIARRFSAFGADFFLMDGRYFRENGQEKNRQMFGMEQEDWLFDNVKGRATFVMNGSMFFGSYTGKDAFEGQFDTAFERFISRVRKSSGLFCLASGDVHFSEVQALESSLFGYESFELVSSSIHSSTFPGHQNRFRNSRRRASTGSHNFILFEGEFNEDSVRGTATSYGYNSALFRVPVLAKR